MSCVSFVTALLVFCFFFQAEDGIRDVAVTGVQTCALPILFLDEPTTGLDPQSRRQLWEVIGRFRAAGGTVLLTTHYMEEAERLCDRVAIMDHGKEIALGTRSEEHTSELQSRLHLVCRLLLEKKKKIYREES